MDPRETLKAARQSKLRTDALLERRGWCLRMGGVHSGGPEALARLRQELDQRIDETVAQSLAAQAQIDALADPVQRDVLRYRYLNGWAWKEIGRRMKLSPDWVKHLHARALRELGDSALPEERRS